VGQLKRTVLANIVCRKINDLTTHSAEIKRSSCSTMMKNQVTQPLEMIKLNSAGGDTFTLAYFPQKLAIY
jgi:hypothetical protein